LQAVAPIKMARAARFNTFNFIFVFLVFDKRLIQKSLSKYN
jgi:hypothetical protein